MVGNFADATTEEEKNKINHITRWYKPPFYKHVETFLQKGEGEEYIPLREYLLRHDKVETKIENGEVIEICYTYLLNTFVRN